MIESVMALIQLDAASKACGLGGLPVAIKYKGATQRKFKRH
jgi:hypothetical protein